uniref:sphingomyelin phosphodiesterase n=1 Tax=Strigops habroptila TaxID=2489341 RepID=A0A672TJD4_STRHB
GAGELRCRWVPPVPGAAPAARPAMPLPESPFRSPALAALDAAARALLAPGFWALNQLLDLRPTTAERRRRRQSPCGWCRGCAAWALAGPVLAVLLLLSLPVTALGLLLWLPLQAARSPFVYQHTAAAAPAKPWDLRQRRTFTFLSANLCLLPSGLAKFSNLGQTPQRAADIARQLPPPLSESFPPDADILCLQEVFDAAAATCLRRRLGRVFPHIISEVGTGGLCRGRLRLLGSGLFLASRFPVLAAAFHSFPNGAREDAMADKGLLLVQVLLGSARHRRVVGYIGCTHLQAPAGDGAVREAQLTLALRWLQQFQQEQEQSGDVVAFDVLCGDLNFDNCSPDQLNQRHQLFKVYQDPCRRAPGAPIPCCSCPMLCPPALSPPVSHRHCPPHPCRTLSSPSGRRQFLAGPILTSGQPDATFPGPWRGRRLDYVVFRPRPPMTPLSPQDVAAVSFITRLAMCSDHLPVALSLHVVPGAP